MKCSDDDCDYNITVVEQTQNASHVFVCGSNSRGAMCCYLNKSQQSPVCVPSEEMKSLSESIKGVVTEEVKHSVLVETEHSRDLYMTIFGSQEYPDGIYKFGRKMVLPVGHNREQHYSGLLLSKRSEDPSQDRVYAFYKQNNRDSSLDSKIWTSYVTQVCTADVGGPKNHLQSRWTSQMNARLFCGDVQHRKYFSELIETTIVHSDRWQDTRVYALFKNEWGMSAICVYSIQDINSVFMNSLSTSEYPLKKRPRKCVGDSTKISSDILSLLSETSEMKEWVIPMESGFIFLNHHHYNHMCVDSSQTNRSHQCTVLFLSLNNGRIHKVVQCINHFVIVTEYKPFSHTTHILNMMFHPPSRKLYVNSRDEMVQLNVGNCGHYGLNYEDCCLSSDPYCGWNNTHCTSDTHDTQQDVVTIYQHVCPLSPPDIHHSEKESHVAIVNVTLAPQSKYFLRCKVSSHHANYTWRKHNTATACSSKMDECVYFIDSMGPEQVGIYRCVSEEKGYSKVVVEYRLLLKSRAPGQQPGSVLWLCVLMLVLMASHSIGNIQIWDKTH
ncbi:semaphorin-7A isoform X2 [Gouania willdenowi]|nr:semaphorin-7A-like isoform X2 [Gouania willdenowi]